ncbi:hypothetical protein [Chishuiella sp.]|uniref:hypothetical protein n=1 Tax=Chishuiella sp. TaxID=1969467 RepID=UPI0028ABBE77|nr:hypothetical protein [Chishuiella sp.]
MKLYSTFLLKNKRLVKNKKVNARFSVISDISNNSHFCVLELEDGKKASAVGPTAEVAFMKMINLFNQKYAA